MDTPTKRTFTLQFEWRWIVAGYCYLVLFHLFPTFMLGGLVFPRLPGFEGATLRSLDLATVWLFLGLAVVSFVVGYRSRGFTIFEPAVAGILYAFTTAAGFQEAFTSNVRDRLALAVLFWLLIVVILTIASAWLGEMVQRRRAVKSHM